MLCLHICGITYVIHFCSLLCVGVACLKVCSVTCTWKACCHLCQHALCCPMWHTTHHVMLTVMHADNRPSHVPSVFSMLLFVRIACYWIFVLCKTGTLAFHLNIAQSLSQFKAQFLNSWMSLILICLSQTNLIKIYDYVTEMLHPTQAAAPPHHLKSLCLNSHSSSQLLPLNKLKKLDLSALYDALMRSFLSTRQLAHPRFKATIHWVWIESI